MEATPKPKTRSLARRVFRIIATVLGVAVGLVLLAAGGGILWLKSESGERFVLRKVLSTVNGTIAGRLEIDRLQYTGFLRVEADAVRLYAPAGVTPVISTGRLWVDVGVLDILRGRIELKSLLLDRPQVHLLQDGDSTGLGRALASRAAPSPSPSGTPASLPHIGLVAPVIQIRQGSFDMDGSWPIGVEALDVDVAADGFLNDIGVTASIRCRTTQPAARDLVTQLRGRVSLSGARVDALSIRIGQTRIDATASGNFDASKVKFVLQRLSLAAADVNAFVPQAALTEDMDVAAAATLEKQKADAHVAVTLPSGSLVVDASVLFGGAFDQLVDYRATVKVDGVAIHKLRKDLPVASITAALSVNGKGLPTRGTADVDFDASGSEYEKLKADRISLRAHIAAMSARIDWLDVRSAGVAIDAAGTAGLEEGDLKMTVEAPVLRETGTRLARGLGIKLPALDGRLHIAATAGGHWTNPHGTLAIDGSRVAIDTTHVASLRTSITLNDWTPDPRGSFSIVATGVQLKDKKCGDLRIAGAVDAHRAHLDGGGQLSGNPASLTLRGNHAPGTAWTFGTFQTTVLGKTLASDTPFTVQFADGRLRIQRLNLSGDLGRLSLDANVAKKGPIDAKLTLRGFHAENLPPVLLPDGLNLAGSLDLAADVKGSFDDPTGNLHLTIKAARFRSLSNLGLDTNIHVAGMRAVGTLSATAAKGTLQLSFDVPLVPPAQAFSPRAPELPLKLALSISHLSLKDLSGALLKPIPLLADINGQLNLEGTTLKPMLTTSWDGANISYESIDHGHVHVAVTYLADHWNADVEVNRADSVALQVKADVRIPVAELISGNVAHDPKLTGEASVNIEKVDLKWLASHGYGPADLAGVVKGAITLGGSPQKPHASGQISVSSLAVAGYQDLDVHLDVKTTDRITIEANALASGRPVVKLDAAFVALPGHVAGMALADWLSTPFTLHAVLDPTATSILIPSSPAVADADPPAFRGIASGVIDASGPANSPKLHLRLRADETSSKNASIGTFTAAVDYEKAHLSVKSEFESKSAGTLNLAAELSPDLGASALLKTGSLTTGLMRALSGPANISVDTTHFDLAIAEGLVGPLHRLGGVMDLHVRKTGPLLVFGADKTLDFGATLAGFSASLALEKGRMSMLGYGSFADLGVKASVHATSIDVSDIEGKSGKGSFHGNASLATTGSGDYKGAVQLALLSFPIEQDFQTLGTISLQIAAAGTGGHGRIDIPRIELSGGHAIIPDRIPRNIQSMEPNAEITFTDAKPKKVSKLERAAEVWVIHIGEIVIPDDFVVDAPLGAQLKLGAQLAVASAPPGGPPVDVTGSIHIVEGHVTLLRRFDVDHGKLTFIAGHVDNPEVLVKAHYDGPDATVRITLSGTIDDLQRSFESTPRMSENEILSYLATGQRPTASENSDPAYFQGQLTDAAISALGAAAIGVVHGAVGQFLPGMLDPDVVSVQSNVARGGLGPIRAGKFYLKGKLYVGGQYNPTANPLLNENEYEGEGDYRLGASKSLRLIVGTEGHDSLYFLIERNFETTRQKKSHTP